MLEIKDIIIDTEDLLLFEINTESNISIQNEKEENISLKIAQNIEHNIEESKIKISLLIRLESQKNDDFAEFENINFFFIENSEKYLLKFEGEDIFHPLLVTTLLSVSFSTSRGIIFEKLKNTLWKETILPIISPQKLLLD